MKKFSLKQYIKSCYELDILDTCANSLHFKWPIECDGLTEEEMKEKGYSINEIWMVD